MRYALIAAIVVLVALPASLARAQYNWDDIGGPRGGSDQAAPASDSSAERPASDSSATPAEPPRQQIIIDMRSADRMPGDLRGKAALFPIGRPADGMKACLYVPSYYSPSRAWPVLVDGNQQGHLKRSLSDFVLQAEKHGFILLSVEYLYFRGQSAGRRDVWTRDGGGSVGIQSRPLDEYQRDMVVDEKVLLAVLKDLSLAYSVEKKAVGATGFLGAGLMTYRLPLLYPQIFCTGIVRSGDFSPYFLPSDLGRVREKPLFIIYGDKEEDLTLTSSTSAVAFFKSRNFANVQAERIPNSGVDSRPEIVANYFRGTVDSIVGPEQASFFRVTNLASQFLADRLPVDALGPMGRPLTGEDVLRSLNTWIEEYPRSPGIPYATFLAARLYTEKLDKPAAAEPLLRKFTSWPLLTDAAAPEALLYLVEHVIDPRKNPEEARPLLAKIVSRRDAPADVVQQARKILDQVIADLRSRN